MNACINEMIGPALYQYQKGQELGHGCTAGGPRASSWQGLRQCQRDERCSPCVTRRSGLAAPVGWDRSLPTRLRCWLGWRGWRKLQPVTGRFCRDEVIFSSHHLGWLCHSLWLPQMTLMCPQLLAASLLQPSWCPPTARGPRQGL